MNEPAALGFLVAFFAGLLSFLSPCVLPLVPSYVGFITGMTLPEVTGRRRAALTHALLFVAGFSLVFVLLGASATALGRALNYYQVWLQRVGGVLIILFGLLCLGVFKVGLLTRSAGFIWSASRSAIWGPCWWAWRSPRVGRRASVRCSAEFSGWQPPQTTSPEACSCWPRTRRAWHSRS